MKNDVIVSIENLHVNLMTTRGVVCAVRGADLDIKKGEIHGLVGESGCGKTMTSKSILRLHDEKRMLYEGSIKLRDSKGSIKDILQLPMNEVRKMRGSEVSMIFQDPVVSLNPLLTIGNQMVEMLRTHYQDMTKDQAKQKTLKLLDLVGIKPAAERYKQYPFEFSGGMLQRIMIAMALSCDPQLLIADECTTALDVTTQAQILDLMKHLQETIGMSILFITHNFGVVAEICDRASVMYAGKIVETSTVEDLFDHPKHPYTKALYQSIPSLDKDVDRLHVVPGMVTDPSNLPEYCSFADRCEAKCDLCEKADPKMIRLNEEHCVKCLQYTKEWEGKINE